MQLHPLTRLLFLLLTLPLLSRAPPPVPPDWSMVTSVEALWAEYPERLRSLFQALDPGAEALEPVREALLEGDSIKAGKALVAYYRQVDRPWVVSALDPLSEEEAHQTARRLLHDTVSFNGVTARVPARGEQGWQWHYTGPEPDDEFGYSLNGHRYLTSLLVHWQETDSATYANAFDERIRDWVIHHPLPEADDSIYLVLDTARQLDWRDIGEVEWRTLEAGQRLGATWPQTFYGFQSAEAFSPAARLLMLSSIVDQAGYLQRYHKQGHNWTTMEMNGLALAGLAFPEFKEARSWADYAREVMSREIRRQVYPDGVQTEISTKTQWVALNRFESIANNFERAGREIAPAYRQRVEEMYNYLAYSLRPDGHQPLNNDSDREDLRPRLLAAARKFNRPDWRWVATNGQAGQRPDSLPTVTFPWGGMHVMRNGWDSTAHWSFFDGGPFGTGHQHADKLHLSVAAYGKDLLVDGGRYTHQNYFSFDPTIWRGYFRSSLSHNVILVNGQGQNGGPVISEASLQEGTDYVHTENYDFARSTFDDGYAEVPGKAVHSRSVLYIHDRYWIVLDHFDTDQPQTLQALWHYAPTCRVELEENEAVSTNVDEGNLRIVPLGEMAWQATIVSGQEQPFIQGWYSEEYGTKVPNPTVVYTSNVLSSTTFAWLLIPARGEVPRVSAQFRIRDETAELIVEGAGPGTQTITLPIREGLPTVDTSDE